MTINVMYEFSELYSQHASVSIVSLMENNKNIDKINIYVLDDGITEESKNRILSLVGNYGRHITFINTDNIKKTLINHNVPLYKGSYATYYKLFAMEYLPSDVKKILYLDSDTVVIGELEELFDTDISNNPCAMVIDPIFDIYKDIIGIGRDRRYYNCGMGLFNRYKWENECQKDILKLIKKQPGFFIMDQDIINTLYSDNIKTIPLKYNLTGAFVLYSSDDIYKLYKYSEKTMYTKEEIDEAKANPVICHYISYQAGRPWEVGNIHPMTPLYDKYLQLTPWHDMPKIKGKYPFITLVQRYLYKYLPRPIYIIIHRIILSNSMEKMARKAEIKQ